jgi:hypothetical protein
MLRWLKTVAVSDVEKAHVMRQVGIGKTVRSPRFRGSLVTCRNSIRWHQNRGVVGQPGMSLAGVRVLARRCPACRRREPGLRLLQGTWEGMPRYCGPRSCGRREGVAESVVPVRQRVLSRGVPTDRLVVAVKSLLGAVGVEPRGRVICGVFVRSTGSVFPGGVAWTR